MIYMVSSFVATAYIKFVHTLMKGLETPPAYYHEVKHILLFNVCRPLGLKLSCPRDG